MNIVFRTDASLKMGSGHLMRCLTLADALKAQGAHCHFICREHPGHLNNFVLERGHSLHVLPFIARNMLDDPFVPVHAGWLGAPWYEDAEQTAAVLETVQPDWLVVDHYALEKRWEQEVSRHCNRLMALDDLADRSHYCDLLLDQSLGRTSEDYHGLIPDACRLLLGPSYALLRPKFSELRARSLASRKNRSLSKILISMGGVDASNATGMVLQVLGSIVDPNWQIQVVMGANAPWLSDVCHQVELMQCFTQLLVNTPDMASLMSDADIAIGAAGSTSWERCCLGLPTIMLILAENQRLIGQRLHEAGAAFLIPSIEQIPALLPIYVENLHSPEELTRASKNATVFVDGIGTQRAIEAMMK
ncbi:UDP-2,4-diacetamido-2,4,6-trideoxy-beta-L-altropyranose hydrolase [Pseudomonas delhiensis]|uniref:UDP-2,4-diacetamido-2,4,6-trideoxy-beta-L-altropyranose hydrolase n=1 Tax=Pseudomonas delhiensis TaxID=366289 RepID=A0A239IRF4_9PSED|nr:MULTISPECIES: UDP-2,4-diacetamido-2,4,6-trideoxy-beta-L-altropyranose hydrolase [Pseudomonas]SDI66195.1 UDP-2,4-diacetamido-2,4,6-trideoxy-beta-L-altropyranose hydrolase [Pseudomonas delhiensis]SNS95663.1 UDP-2,4-diacetamido-2,4,6-trideoxy-beta-L-altropyranose hydrolase [Pseudomonas delhiensis]